MQEITENCNVLAEHMATHQPTKLKQNWLIFVFFFLILYISWRLTVVTFGAFLLSGLIKICLKGKESNKDDLIQNGEKDLKGILNDCFSTNSDIQSNLLRFEAVNTYVGDLGAKKAIITGFLAAIILFIDMFFRQSIISYAQDLYIADSQDVSEFNLSNFGDVGTSIAIQITWVLYLINFGLTV